MDQDKEWLFTRDAAVGGRMFALGNLVAANLDDRAGRPGSAQAKGAGIAAFDASTGDMVWSVHGVPSLAAVSEDTVYAFSRSGLVVALNKDGSERWRTAVPDDRTQSAASIGERDGPYTADVLPAGPIVTIAAGGALLALATNTGQILGRTVVCVGENGVVSRIAPLPYGAVAVICTQRPAWEDELAHAARTRWQPAIAAEPQRPFPCTIAVFDVDYRLRWRLGTAELGKVYSALRPAVLGGSRIVLAAASLRGTGELGKTGNLEDQIMAIDGASGHVLWRRGMPGGRGQVDPVSAGDGVIAGFELVRYASVDGAVSWHASPDAIKPVGAAPLLDGRRLLVASRGTIQAVSIGDGAVISLGRFGRAAPTAVATTNLVRIGSHLYLGVDEPGWHTQLRAIALEPDTKSG